MGKRIRYADTAPLTTNGVFEIAETVGKVIDGAGVAAIALVAADIDIRAHC